MNKMPLMISIKALFFDSPAKSFSLSVRALKQLNTDEKINRAKRENRRVIACGTTSVRVLESASKQKGIIEPISGFTEIFIYPPYKFKCVDALITNFHLPESTLLMLVSAFYGKDRIMDAYKCAVEEKYRFFSFGDAMFIE